MTHQEQLQQQHQQKQHDFEVGLMSEAPAAACSGVSGGESWRSAVCVMLLLRMRRSWPDRCDDGRRDETALI